MPVLRADLSFSEVYITEQDKTKEAYLKGMTDYWIGKLVVEKKHIPVARKYYSGVRDSEEYQYLNDNYGIGNPIDIQFTPIIKPRIDALIGLYLDESFNYRISVTDDKTLDLEKEARKNYIIESIVSKLNAQKAAYDKYRVQKKEGLEVSKPSDPLTKDFADRLNQYLDKEFVSVYVKAAQHLVNYFEQSNTLQLRRKFADLLYDLLITGEMFWRTHIEEEGKDPIFDVVKPENLFFNKNKNSLFLDSSDAVVHREFMTRHQVLTKYGHLMKPEDIKKITGRWGGSNSRRKMVDSEMLYFDEELDDEFSNLRQYTGDQLDVIEVFHVEWLASSKYDKQTPQSRNPVEQKNQAKKSGWIEHRYEVTRIMGDVYVGAGRSKNVIRSKNNKYKATLSYNGISYNLRNGIPYSMVLSLKDVQDMYDITQFHRNNMVATAGVAGTRVNIAGIPKVLGSKFMDRLMKWIALRKQGVELIDPTEEGANLFQHYGDFPGGIDGNTIQGINAILQTLMQQVVLTTGITDQILGQIQQREAVENVKTGIQQVSLIILNIFDLLDTARKDVLTRLIDLSKISYKKGVMGAYRVGTSYVAFKVDKDDFTWTDYNIQVTNSSKDLMKIQKLEALVMELVGAGAVKPEAAVELIFAKTIDEARDIVYKYMNTDEQQQQQMEQMMQQVQQYEQQLGDAAKQAADMERKIARFSQEQLALDRERLELDKVSKARELELQEKKINSEINIDNEEIKAQKEVVQLEREQLYIDGASNQAKEINNSKFKI